MQCTNFILSSGCGLGRGFAAMHSDGKWLQNQPVSDMLKVYTMIPTVSKHSSKAIHYTPEGSKAVHYTPVGSKAIHYTPVGSKAIHYTLVGSKATHYTLVGSKAIHYTPEGSKATHYTLVGFFKQCATPKVMLTPGATLGMYCNCSLQTRSLAFWISARLSQVYSMLDFLWFS